MGDKYAPKVGDRVRVVIEAEVKKVDEHRVRLKNWVGSDSHLVFSNQDDITFERIGPTVEQFKPGDVVRRKQGACRGHLHLGHEGFFNERRGLFFEYGERRYGYLPAPTLAELTSENYEKVTLG